MNAQNMWTETSHFFSSYVKQGKIDYPEIRRSGQDQLQSLVQWIGVTDLDNWSSDQSKAFLINAYNILVIQSVIEAYPILSPLDEPGFFRGRTHTIAGKRMTLETLEKKYLLEAFADPRIHLVLVCAADGCPPMRDQAYLPEGLDAQIEDQSRVALNDPQFVQVDEAANRVSLSQIFVWYAVDFRRDGHSIRSYVNQFRDQPLPEAYNIRYYAYDWSLNSVEQGEDSANKSIPIQSYTPSVLLRPRQVEFKAFLNLYTQRHFFDEGRRLTWANERATFLTTILQWQVGVSNRLNVGLDMYVRSATFRDPNTSALEVFTFRNDPIHRTAISQIGPKIRYTPFKTPGISLQTTLLFPTATDLQGRENPDVPEENRPFLDHDGYQFFHSFLYDRAITARLRFYGDLGVWLRLDRNFDGDNTGVTTPMKIFLTYFANPRTSFYGMTDFGPNWGSGYYLQSGLGVKTQMSAHFELEFLYTNFWTGRVSGGGYTLNPGARWVY